MTRLGESSGIGAGLDFELSDMGLVGWHGQHGTTQSSSAPQLQPYQNYLANERLNRHPSSLGGHSSEHGHAQAYLTNPLDRIQGTSSTTHTQQPHSTGGLTTLPPMEMPLPSTPPYASGSVGLDHDSVNVAAVPEGFIEAMVRSQHGHSDEGSSLHHH